MALGIAAGEKVAFTRGADIFVGTAPNLTRAKWVGRGQDPSLTSDGALVAFEEEAKEAKDRRIVLKEVARGGVIAKYPGILPKLSPDGKMVFFSRFKAGGLASAWTLWKSDPTLHSPKAVGPAKGGPGFANGWAGGKLIAHTEDLDGKIFVLRPDGSVEKAIPFKQFIASQDIAVPFGLAVAPDGNRIVFESLTGETRPEDDEPQTGLYLSDLRGGVKPKRLTPKGMDGTRPCWYGGNVIAFTGFKGNGRSGGALHPALYLMDVSTGEMRSVLPNADNVELSHRGA